jgi:hypothetical protein
MSDVAGQQGNGDGIPLYMLVSKENRGILSLEERKVLDVKKKNYRKNVVKLQNQKKQRRK